MVKHLSNKTTGTIILVQRKTGDCGRHPLKEGGNFVIPRFTYSRAPGYIKYNMGNSKRLLVADPEEGRYGIHQGM
jgi:hypothetical protein